MTRNYITPQNRFQPFLNIRIGIKGHEKKCSKCGIWRPLVDWFSPNRNRKYGYHSQCTVCQGVYGDLYRRIYVGSVK